MSGENTIHPVTSDNYPDVLRDGAVVAATGRIDRAGTGPHRRAGLNPPSAQDASSQRPIEKTSCTYQGKTFFGDFCVSGNGPDAIVSVHHHGQELEAKLGKASIESAAENLLQEMVMREMISMVVTTR